MAAVFVYPLCVFSRFLRIVPIRDKLNAKFNIYYERGNMHTSKKIKVGVGFATGRKRFQKVLKTYVYNWRESGLTELENVELSLFVAYDLKYYDTQPSDYTNIRSSVRELINQTFFIGEAAIRHEADELVRNGALTADEAKQLFGGEGYATKRNAILYAALKNQMDYLLFLDDDEYPVAVTKTRDKAIWSGQQVLDMHLHYIRHADITNGHHCGYISPIPHIRFDETLREADFRTFIEAISNDIINWDNIRAVMEKGGVTYADTQTLIDNRAVEVEEVAHTKFISGSNLCINLTRPERVQPFYNPPGARGEDTFLSTCLSDHKVLRVPVYAFHDGFSTYRHLMDGVLPTMLKPILADNDQNITRFYKACVGWVRYKPLLLYITQRENYEQRIAQMKRSLAATLPAISAYFGRHEFMLIPRQLERYHRRVERHYQDFMELRRIWAKVCRHI